MRSLFAALLAGLLAGEAVAQEGWTFSNSGMPPPHENCTAVRLGSEINTRVMRNDKNKMTLIAANGSWDLSDPVVADLSVDGAPSVMVFAMTVGPLALAMIEDPALEARLLTARTLDWSFPWGKFHADVTGLGEAYAKVKIC